MRTKGEGAAAAAAAIAEYEQQKLGFLHELTETQNAILEVEKEQQAARVALASALIQETSEALLQAIDACTLGGELVQKRQAYIAARGSHAARLAVVEQDADFVNRESLTGPDGSLQAQRAQLEAELVQAKQALVKFKVDSFQWCLARLQTKKENDSAFANFWRAVTLGNLHERQKQKRACKELGYIDWETLFEDYEEKRKAEERTQLAISENDEHQRRVASVVAQQRELHQWVHDFEGALRAALQRDFVSSAGKLSLDELYKRFREQRCRPQISTAIGVDKKLEYLRNIATFLEKEIADRQNRIQGIDRTRRLWVRKPYAPLTGDKTKWLVTVPKLKQASSQKRQRWVRSMRHNIYGYRRWDRFDHYMYMDDDFLYYDAFAYGCEEPMPYDGFAREVIDDVAPYREAHGQEKQDYSALKEADKGAGDWQFDEEAEAAAAAEADAEAAAAALVAEEMLDSVDAS